MEQEETLLIKNVSPLFNEYEKIFKSLKNQIELYTTEHESLKENINKLLQENTILSKKYGELLHSKIINSSTVDEKFENDLINNLRNQLTLISEEKNTTYDLWQNSLQIIDHLESELRVYRGNKEEFITKAELDRGKQKHVQEIKSLEKKLKLALNEIGNKNKTALNNLEVKDNELTLALEGQRKALFQTEEKEKEITELKSRLDNILQTCTHLEQEVKKRDDIINTLVINEQDSRGKVLESVILIEAALAEKEEAFMRESRAKEEIAELSKSLTELVKETDEKMKNEIKVVKEQYNENLNKLIKDMKKIQETLDEKEQQLEKARREIRMLEEENSKLQKGNTSLDDNSTSKLLALEKNFESTFQRLLLSERKYVQISAERDSIKMDMEQIVQSLEMDRKTSEIDKQSLERKIQTLQKELSISNGFVEEYVVQIKELNSRMMDMEQDMKNKIELKERMFDELLRKKVNHVKSESSLLQKELHMHLNSEHNLNKRWKSEMREITAKLQNRIKELKHENCELRKFIQNFQENGVT